MSIVNKVLYNLDTTADTTEGEKEQARINIGIHGSSWLVPEPPTPSADLLLSTDSTGTMTWIPKSSSGGIQPSQLSSYIHAGNTNIILNQYPSYLEISGANADWNASSGQAGFIENKPSLATVATTGSYTDLSNKPSIPAAQVNTDWRAQTGKAVLLNKPITIPNATGGLRTTLTADDITNGYAEFLVSTGGVYSGDQAFTNPTFFLCSTMEQFRYNSGFANDYIDTVEVGLYSPGIVGEYKKYYDHTHAEVVADAAKGWGLSGWWSLTKDNYLSVYVRMHLTSAAVAGDTISAHFTSAIFGTGLFPY